MGGRSCFITIGAFGHGLLYNTEEFTLVLTGLLVELQVYVLQAPGDWALLVASQTRPLLLHLYCILHCDISHRSLRTQTY